MGIFILTGEFSSANFVLSTKLEESHSQPEKTMLMRTRTFILCLLALCLSTIRGYASGLGDFRVNARFLTDRMAFELHLNSNQYNDLYEINYDFLLPHLDRIGYTGWIGCEYKPATTTEAGLGWTKRYL